MARRTRKKRNIPEQARHLSTVQAVVEALGGLDVVQRITDCRHKTSVHNWIATGCFPARYFKVMTDALMALGFTAPHSLWDQRGNHDLDDAA